MPTFLEKIITSIPNGIYYLAIAFIVWKIAEFYFVRFCNIEKRTLDIAKIEERLSKNIEPLLTNINSTIDRISRYIITKDILDSAFFITQSPIELNKSANEILIESGAKNFVDSSLKFLITKIDERNPKSALDIQQLAVSVIFDLVDTESFSKIKDFVYQNPNYKGNGINLPIIINIVALYLRNEYFKKHPELKELDLE